MRLVVAETGVFSPVRVVSSSSTFSNQVGHGDVTDGASVAPEAPRTADRFMWSDDHTLLFLLAVQKVRGSVASLT